MKNERILLSTPDVGQIEEDYLVAAIRSGWVAPAGPDLNSFENELKQRVGAEHAVALASGTAALHLGLLSLGVQPGNLVVTSTMTFAATVNAICYTGATPFFVDCDPVTGNISPELLVDALDQLESVGTPASAVVPVDLLGKAADYTEIERICGERGLPVLCDSAESLGATHAGSPTGSFGTASVFSFNGNKIMTTSGGGMLVTDDSNIAEYARYLSTQARQPVVHYQHVDIGYNYRMSNILAALGRAQLSRLDTMIVRRRHWRMRYREFFDEFAGIDILGGPQDAEDNCWLSSIVIDANIAPISATSLRARMDDANIETRPVWKPMHLQPVFKSYPKLVDGSSEHLFGCGLTLPSGSAMTDSEFEFVISALGDSLLGADQ